MILYYIYIYIYINFLPFLCGFSPRCLKDGGRCVVLWLRAGSPGKAGAESRLQEMRWTPVPLSPNTHSFLHVDHPSPLKPSPSVPEKRKPQQGRRSICCRSWFLFLLANYVHGKMLIFPNPNEQKYKPKPKTNHQLGNFCGWNVPKSEALSRHNPCSEGVSPPPLL